jgi:hypothetical protein
MVINTSTIRYSLESWKHNWKKNVCIIYCGMGWENSGALFLGAFENLWKETTSFIMSVCPYLHPSVCPHYTARVHWMYFDRIRYWYTVWNSADKIQVPLKSDTRDVYFTSGTMHTYYNIFLNYFASVNVLDEICRWNKKIISNNFFPENLPLMR